ncbi:MAG: hypothetical protein CVT63_01885 [Candidatus Anoxymicrobium japonicum]|uniref:Uncharacterized protein n=1 Tax=Candidatus Anoxymicrobium japonicum TaxID=2013648 RepID=A0A2N3G7D1_9ACTN|nr:MAG: hypothetical protein CVT63_01885 [Candidatus Anoxymicrobium japonicum]
MALLAGSAAESREDGSGREDATPAVEEGFVVSEQAPASRKSRAGESVSECEEHEVRGHVRKPPTRERASRGRPPISGGFPILMLLIITVAVVTVVVTIIKTHPGDIDFSNFVFFIVVFTVAAHFDLKLKGGGKINLGLAPLLAALIALPVNLPDVPYAKITGSGCAQVVWVFLLGVIVTLITRAMGKLSKEDILGRLLDLSGVGLAALVFFALIKILPKKPELHGHYTPAVLVAATVCACLIYLMYLARESYVLSSEGAFPAVVYFQSTMRKSWLPFWIIVFTGVFMGLVFVGIGMWSLLICLPLLLIFMYAHNQVAATDQYLLETIRVLSAIPEETGMLTIGHADRVARLSVDVAHELGLSPEDMQQVEFAAYLHDIGVITRQGSHDPYQRQLTEVEGVITGGVDIVGKVDYLDVAAEILGGREDLRDRVTNVDKRRVVSIGAGILRAVDDFEFLVQGSESRAPLSESEILTEMNLERGVKYDSKVLRAISRVLSRSPAEQ